MKKEIKPPLGLRPRKLAIEERLNEVRAAILRYCEASLAIPIEWIEEYNSLVVEKEK